MPVLKGTERSPIPVESPKHHKQVNDGARKTQRESYEKRLKIFEDYLVTEEGQAALALVDAERAVIDYEMMLTPRELKMSVDEAQYHKAVLTGERRVWTRLLTEPDQLKSTLASLEGKEDEVETKRGWERMPKIILDKFK